MTTERDSLRWPIALALALAAGVAVSLAFLWIAARQPPDQLRDNAWNAGTGYNAEARARESARLRGWDVELHAERTASGVHVELLPKSARDPLPTPLDVRLRRERPERTDFDADLALEPSGSRWVADVPLPLGGRWLLVAHAGDADAWVERTFALEVTP
jgi:nitrogen fixation protein FixH